MIFIYDNLTATIIAMSVFLLLVTIQFRTTQTNIAQTSRNIVKEQAQGFATWLEDDLEKMGQNIGPGSAPPYNVAFDDPTDSSGVTVDFTFYQDSIVSTSSTMRVATQYRVKKTGTRVVEADTVDLYQLTRYRQEGASASWVEDGRSIDALGYFDVDMLNRDAQPIINPRSAAQTDQDTVRSTRVRFSVVAPFQNEKTSLRVVHFGSVLLLRNEN